MNSKVTLVIWYLYIPQLCGQYIIICCLAVDCAIPYHIACSFIFVIVSYLGFGQPPLQVRLITFLLATTLFVYIYNPRWFKLETLNFTLIPAHIDTRILCLARLGYVVNI